MRKFEVEIEETLCKIVTVESCDEDTAYRQVKEAYGNEEYILESENFVGYSIKVLGEKEK